MKKTFIRLNCLFLALILSFTPICAQAASNQSDDDLIDYEELFANSVVVDGAYAENYAEELYDIFVDGPIVFFEELAEEEDLVQDSVVMFLAGEFYFNSSPNSHYMLESLRNGINDADVIALFDKLESQLMYLDAAENDCNQTGAIAGKPFNPDVIMGFI